MNSSIPINVKEFCQADIALCKEHSTRIICSIFCKSKCPYKSRLACSKCMQQYNSFCGFEDVLDVLKDPIVILKNNDRPLGIYDVLNQYFNQFEEDQNAVLLKCDKQFILAFKEDILKQIQKLEQELKDGIEKYRNLKIEIAKAKQQFYEALGLEQLRQNFKDIVKIQNYLQSKEWGQFEQKVQNFILQFDNQTNQELNATCYKLMQLEQKIQLPELLFKFKANISQSMDSLYRNFGSFSRFTSLCDPLCFYELINRIAKQKNVQPNISLIYRASLDGLNSLTFSQKCGNRGPTLMFCKSKSGHVFGGYTPAKWIPNGNFQKDETKTSFIFSYNRKEIFPILLQEQAVLQKMDGGPQFGESELIFASDFKSGSSNLTGKHYSIENRKFENPRTHLFGGEQPDLLEMEVFLIE